MSPFVASLQTGQGIPVPTHHQTAADPAPRVIVCRLLDLCFKWPG